ncbi:MULTISPECIES: BLUF domain-containing protein [unclassified Variovorax]|uniref:BLUF domain-containing protein n=1 Tax=unclassified Variovorax TaxID=663243 RepID=UPI00088FEC28|nr:BLUF domain-containing protein [Variovorax sp. CF079]SDC67774.1 Sensors of blue-light using FAD [Variovorax sp. CF079]
MTELHEILYCSLLAPGQPTEVVGQIVTRARARNATEGITGLLVFDGMRFCQHFEGPRKQVLGLLNRLEADPRHIEMRVVYEGGLSKRRYQRFEMGLAQTEDGEEGEDIAILQQLDGAEALERFLALRPRLDIAG